MGPVLFFLHLSLCHVIGNKINHKHFPFLLTTLTYTVKHARYIFLEHHSATQCAYIPTIGIGLCFKLSCSSAVVLKKKIKDILSIVVSEPFFSVAEDNYWSYVPKRVRKFKLNLCQVSLSLWLCISLDIFLHIQLIPFKTADSIVHY